MLSSHLNSIYLYVCSSLLLLSIPAQAQQSNHPKRSSQLQNELAQQAKVAQEPGACHFNPPAGWEYIDPSSLPELVKIMVRGKGSHEIPPSINLAVEETPLTKEAYLDAIRELHQYDRRTNWTVLGNVNSQGHEISLTQLDTKTKWGEARMIQAILIHSGVAYVLTCTAQKSEFAKYSAEFFKAINSFTVNKTVFELVQDQGRRNNLELAYQQLLESWKGYFKRVSEARKNLTIDQVSTITFNDNEFQKNAWMAFENFVNTNYVDLGDKWKQSLFNKVKRDLFQINATSS